ncbi:MAG: spore coat protein U domain-containing protein [Burkholderiales bacterium]|nr:spore coat protein U domain-containing protein [Burkholderiales bacterium]
MKFNKLGLVGALCAAGLLGNTSALAADTANVAVSATVVGTCKFNNGGTAAFILDPSVGGNVAATVTQPQFWCTKGATYSISDNDGLNALAGAQRMKHASLAEYIPYSFSYTAGGTGTGPSTPITMNITSSVVAADYMNASAGSYADTVILSITP